MLLIQRNIAVLRLQLLLSLIAGILSLKGLSAAELIDCPDCKKKVSSRAVFCPKCGCPGEAIAKKFQQITEAKRPKPLLIVTTPSTKGYSIPIELKGERYVVMDAALLGVLDSLSLTPLNKTENLLYQEFEIAIDAPLARFKADSEHIQFLKLAEGTNDQGGKKYLMPDASFSNNSKPSAVAMLNSGQKVIALNTSSKGFVPLHPKQEWIKVPPSKYRIQVELLDKHERNNASTNHDGRLRSTQWLSQYLKNRAENLLN